MLKLEKWWDWLGEILFSHLIILCTHLQDSERGDNIDKSLPVDATLVKIVQKFKTYVGMRSFKTQENNSHESYTFFLYIICHYNYWLYNKDPYINGCGFVVPHMQCSSSIHQYNYNTTVLPVYMFQFHCKRALVICYQHWLEDNFLCYITLLRISYSELNYAYSWYHSL